MRETLAALSGGRVTEMPSRPADAPPAMTTGDLLRATTLSGTHTVARTVRGSWKPLHEREPINWGEAGSQPRGPDGRFIVVVHDDAEDGLDD
jgi:hypothetical protein